jgi:DNA-binding beta-propeller fold protein YncE
VRFGRFLRAGGLVAVLVLALSACAGLGQAPAASAGDLGSASGTRRSFAGSDPAPEFPPLEWLNTDRPLTLQDLRGKVVLLDFWTYGCINCMHIIPDLKRLETKYADELVVIGVHSAKFAHEADTENIRQIILRYEREHPVVNDKDLLVWRMYGARAWPTLVAIDPAGNVVGYHEGEGVYDVFDPLIGGLVAEFDAKGLMDRRPLDLKLEREGLHESVLSFPGKVLADAGEQRLFIADTNHNRIVVADLESHGVLQVIGGPEPGFADGDLVTARFFHPQGMALSEDGRSLYVADTDNHAVRAVDLSAGRVETLAGTGVQSEVYPGRSGPGLRVALNSPWDLVRVGGQLYVAMAGSHQIWRLDLSNGVIGPWAGSGREGVDDGRLNRATLAQPSGLATDGRRLYVADSEASAVRAIGLAPGGPVETLVGTGLFDFGDADGVGDEVRLQHVLGIAYRPADGLLYLADTYNSKIKALDPETREVRALWGDGPGWRDGTAPLFYEPGGADLAGDRLYVADTNNHAVRVVDLPTGETATVVLRDTEGLLTQADPYNAEVVTLAPQQIAPGPGVIDLDVTFPPGYKANDLAPSSIAWQTQELLTFDSGEAIQRLEDPRFPLELGVTFRGGEGTVAADMTLYYCEEDKESLCLIHQVRLEVPLVVEEGGAATLALDYAVPEPDLP